MSYQVLARKWRPRSFKEMVGQSHILRALINALDNDRLHHAYLFTGTRGVGKTTIARILAKSLNCEKGVSSTPCGECSTCIEVDEGRFVDLIEVDAASRTKVDETRELLDNVQYAPTRGRYKVYLIDEVHMFSNHSFNALLKTLEEPPPHVKFLLATTDPQKLPVTILSRCLQFNLKALPQEQIHGHMDYLLEQEKIPADSTSVRHIARAAQGSMRDALSLLDQAIAFGAGELKEADVCDMLGVIEQHFVMDVLNGLLAQDASALLACVHAMSEQSVDYESVLVDVLSMLQRIAVAQVAPDTVDDLQGDQQAILKLATEFSAEDVQLYYQIGLIGRRDLPLAPQLRAGFEMVLLRMLSFQPAEAGSGERRPKAATAPNTTPQAAPSSSASNPVAISNLAAVEPAPAPIKAVPSATDDWTSIIDSMGLRGLVHQLAVHCTLVSRDESRWVLLLGEENKQLHREKFETQLHESLQSLLQTKVQLEIQVGAQSSETPAMQTERKKEERQLGAEEDVANDTVVQSLQERFGATVQAVKPID
ncbi:MAG: DNA polymerase III subunit gamma/tau [Sulfuriflexus sp.]|nr:DNA polymerase III subunit gamma/tau [Sulfuriflexus sp.]